jgi:hypothetical protein
MLFAPPTRRRLNMGHGHRHTLLVTTLALGVAGFAAPATAQTAPPAAPAAAPDTARAAAPAAAPAAPAVPAPPPRPRSPWRFVTSFAIQDISGNKQLRVLQTSIRIERPTPDRVVLAFRLEGGYGESGGAGELERRLSSSLRFDWTPRARVSPFLGMDWDYNRVLRINTRLNGSAGANVNLSYRDSSRATLAVGLVEEYLNTAARDASPGSISNDTRFLVRLSLTRTMPSGVQAELNARYQPVVDRPSDYLFKADGTLRVSLTTRLRWETTYRWWRDSAPAQSVMKDDRALITGLAIQW